MLDHSFDMLFARYRRDAILLYRPYPPHSGSPTNSKFGGLPRLPAAYPWPRDANDTPLHFLAQIDCSDISASTQLPSKGVLFFFGRDDEEQLWEDTPASASVIYALDAAKSTPDRSHPPDLPPIGGYYRAKAWQNLLLPDEAGPCVHVEWPIQPLVIDSWPDTLFDDPSDDVAPVDWLRKLGQIMQRKPQPASWQDEQKRYQAYADRHRTLRTDAFIRTTGRPVLEWDATDNEREVARRIFDHAHSGPEAFPQFWIQVQYAVRAFIGRFGNNPTDPIFDHDQLPSAMDWFRKSQAMEGGAEVNEADKAAFRDWLMQLHKPRDGPASPTPYAECVFHGVRLNIRSWAGDPAMAARIPPVIYAEMEPFLSGSSVWGLQYSQMLGHAPSAQDPLHPDDPTSCLLNLASDAALGWMFGDVGNATFYISPEALAEREFSLVEAVVVGH